MSDPNPNPTLTSEPTTQEPAPMPPTDPTPTPEPTPPTPPAPKPDPEPAKPKEPDKPDTKTGDDKKPEEELAGYKARVVNAEAKAAAAASGVPPERLDAVLKLADLGGIDPAASDANEKIAAAIGAALELVPELKTSAAAGTGSLGDHARKQGAKPDPFLQGFGQ